MKRNRKLLAVFILVSSLSLLNETYAQSCPNLGSPMMNVTFGAGSNPGSELGKTYTDYIYTSNEGPPDGAYTIVNSTNGAYGWFKVMEDHTPGDVNGYMMLIDAAPLPGSSSSVVYKETVSGVCENITYELSAWFLYLYKKEDYVNPNITFAFETTDGTLLQTYQTGEIFGGEFAPEWKQYGMLFTPPPGVTSVVVKMWSNATGGSGNDFLLDDITFRPCSGTQVTASIDGHPNAVGACAGDATSFAFTGTASGYNNPFLQWQVSTDLGVTWTDIPGANSLTYQRTPTATAGVYQYRLSVSEGPNSCSAKSGIVTVTVEGAPASTVSNNGPLCEGDELILKALEGNNTYSWTGPQNFTSTDISPTISNVSAANSGKYYVRITSPGLCTVLDSTEVLLSPSPVVNAGVDAAICEGETIRLMGSGSNVDTYNWIPTTTLSNPDIATPDASPKETTLYILKGSMGSCRATDTVNIQVNKKPTADAGPDQMIAKGETTILTGRASGINLSYQWTPEVDLSNPSSLITSARPTVETTYVLNVQSNVGCGTAKDSLTVRIFNGLYVSNAFTPNNDGLNDTWKIKGLSMFPNAEVKVFNRWGQMVYKNKGGVVSWDGKYKDILQPIGGFSYFIDLKNGKNILRGTLLLIR